jgi:hypothetical protein
VIFEKLGINYVVILGVPGHITVVALDLDYVITGVDPDVWMGCPLTQVFLYPATGTLRMIGMAEVAYCGSVERSLDEGLCRSLK